MHFHQEEHSHCQYLIKNHQSNDSQFPPFLSTSSLSRLNAAFLMSLGVVRMLLILPRLLLLQQNFLNFAYANHMQIIAIYLEFLCFAFSRREDLFVTCLLPFGLGFELGLVLSRGICRVIVKSLVKWSIGPLHVVIFHYLLN